MTTNMILLQILLADIKAGLRQYVLFTEISLQIQILSFQEQGVHVVIKNGEKSDTFYLIRLYDENESFYKLGISYKLKNGDIRRFREYRTLNYKIDVLYIKTFNDTVECKEFETKLKRIIRNNLYVPKRWEYNTSTETFTNELLPTIKENLIYDIVSTSDENQSSVNNTDIE